MIIRFNDNIPWYKRWRYARELRAINQLPSRQKLARLRELETTLNVPTIFPFKMNAVSSSFIKDKDSFVLFTYLCLSTDNDRAEFPQTDEDFELIGNQYLYNWYNNGPKIFHDSLVNNIKAFFLPKKRENFDNN